MDSSSPIVPIAIFGGAAAVLYKFAYEPWAAKRALQALTEAQMRANLAKGMGIEEAAQNAIAGACVAAAVAKLHMPPEQAAPMCKGVGILAEKGIVYAAKGAVIAGKKIGQGAAVVGKGVAKGAVAVTKGTGEIVAAAVSVPLAPVKAAVDLVRHPVTGVKRAVVNAVYRNPVAVARTIGGAVAHPAAAVKSVATALIHPVSTVKTVAKVAKKILCFGFCDLGDVDYLDQVAGEGRARARRLHGALEEAPESNPFAVHARNRQGLAKRKRRGLAGLPAGGRRRSSAGAGAEFYLRHL
jgi:hypothetical protein